MGMYAYGNRHQHPDHAFSFDILPFMAMLQQRISVESATDERALRALYACSIRRTAIYNISKITYSLLPRNNRQDFPCSRYRDRSVLYCNKLPDQGINYMHFREILQKI